MQLTTLLVETLKSGKITISQNNKSSVELSISNKKIDANLQDKEFLKEIISGSLQTTTTNKGISESIHRGIDTLREARQIQPLIKDLVEDLCREGVTLTVSYKGDRVITIGSEADSMLTRFVTGTKGIEINSAKRLVEIGL